MVARMILDAQWSVRPMIDVPDSLIGFRPDEIRKDVVVAPADVSKLAPMIVVALVAPNIDQPVEHAAAAKAPAPRIVNSAAQQMSLRDGLKGPVDIAIP